MFENCEISPLEFNTSKGNLASIHATLKNENIQSRTSCFPLFGVREVNHKLVLSSREICERNLSEKQYKNRKTIDLINKMVQARNIFIYIVIANPL